MRSQLTSPLIHHKSLWWSFHCDTLKFLAPLNKQTKAKKKAKEEGAEEEEKETGPLLEIVFDYVANKNQADMLENKAKNCACIYSTWNSCLEILSFLCGYRDNTTNIPWALKDLVVQREAKETELNSQTVKMGNGGSKQSKQTPNEQTKENRVPQLKED